MKRKSWRFIQEDGMNIYKMEAILRHYDEFRALYESQGIDEIPIGGGYTVNIHDILEGINELPKRQKTALILTCLMNLKEIDAAPLMGFKRWTSPVSSYKKLALEKLVEKWKEDNEDPEED